VGAAESWAESIAPIVGAMKSLTESMSLSVGFRESRPERKTLSLGLRNVERNGSHWLWVLLNPDRRV